MNGAPLHALLYEEMDYGEGLLLQESLLTARQREIITDTLLLLEHPPVITIGRHGSGKNILAPRSLLDKEGIHKGP